MASIILTCRIIGLCPLFIRQDRKIGMFGALQDENHVFGVSFFENGQNIYKDKVFSEISLNVMGDTPIDRLEIDRACREGKVIDFESYSDQIVHKLDYKVLRSRFYFNYGNLTTVTIPPSKMEVHNPIKMKRENSEIDFFGHDINLELDLPNNTVATLSFNGLRHTLKESTKYELKFSNDCPSCIGGVPPGKDPDVFLVYNSLAKSIPDKYRYKVVASSSTPDAFLGRSPLPRSCGGTFFSRSQDFEMP